SHQTSDSLSYARDRSSGDHVCTALDGRWALGIFPKRDTGNPQACRFFLDASGICQNQKRVLHHAKEINIAERIDQSNPLSTLCFASLERILKSKFSDALLRARVDRKNDLHLLAQIREAF